MSFHASAENIRVDDGHILRAVLDNGKGEKVEAELDLNTCIGNNNGWFLDFLYQSVQHADIFLSRQLRVGCR